MRALHQAKKTSLKVTTDGFDLAGVRGLFKYYPLERIWRDVRTATLHTRESSFMKLLARGELKGDKFCKAKYGIRLGHRKSWDELLADRPLSKLPAHDASREDLRMISNPVPWPGGARCAIAITWDVDCESSMHWYNQVTADTLIATHTLVRYDLVALPRLIEAFRSREIRQTFFFPGWCIGKHTRHVEALLQEGHEIGLHGYLHERSNELSREDERYWFNRAVEAFIEHVGHAPRGWRPQLRLFQAFAGSLARARLRLRLVSHGRRRALCDRERCRRPP